MHEYPKMHFEYVLARSLKSKVFLLKYQPLAAWRGPPGGARFSILCRTA